MATIYPGRQTARMEGSFVVFLIGVRINRLLAIKRWTSVTRSMGPMLRELYAQPDLGFLHAETSLAWRGVTMIQYWRSFEHLHAYAHARDKAHLPAWAAFNRNVGSDGSVGIWHETYAVNPGQFETVYANMPRWGLAAAGEQVPATGKRNDAKSRMAAPLD
ncbi:protein of unknown function [Granulicella rosea]|uniref:DUF4188 domain-containing protein n=1 Tax=Granulicella rosea TaxID=474952 RepID=A0A239E800_9BACT|nr:DUF4188 domain-containing protein [Granulicella rosea]SNS40014.1 protein of unknown function [Granulicella rosea]